MAWVVGLLISFWFRAEFDATQIDLPGLLRISVVAIAMQLIVGIGFHIYRGRYWIGSIDEALNLTRVTAIVGILVFALDLLITHPWVPRSVPPTATLIALSIAGAARLAVRRYREHRARPTGASARRVIIFGAGAAGQQLVRSMLSDTTSGYLPVALIDDDPKARGKRIAGVSVLGGRDDIGEVARSTEAGLLVFAVPSASAPIVREVSRAAIEAGLGVQVLPPLDELFRPWVGFSDIRDLDIIDLLGRHPVDTDLAGIAGYLANRKVLVTGAGGSIGAELCRQIHEFGPAELMMLDRDESALHAVQLSLHGCALLDLPEVILADIRDTEVVREIFHARKPDVVFHAAALKHLTMLEQYPVEAWKTNVLGTLNVVAAARNAGVERFVNISTDKAANPTSMLGRSKRIGERLVAEAADSTRGTFLSVRFGNVLGSRGSMLTTFAEQLAHGGPLTVTHPDVTRFLMTIREAVQLVVQAAAIGSPGEVLVLDMGAPVRIVDVARQLMELAGRSARIVYTGLRNGEKLHEELFGDGEERDRRPLHPAISHVSVPSLEPLRIFETASAIGPSQALIELTAQPVRTEPGASTASPR
ncbi:MAG: polysaccharide biosynthesis protein [Pseudonocardiaceae bacterium]